VRQPGRERRAVVEHERRRIAALLERSLEGTLALPAREHAELELGKLDGIGDFS
jgi:hypothetical protein